MKILLISLLLASPLVGKTQTGTEIYLLNLNIDSTGQIVLSNPINITQKLGYDNQPFFHPTKPIIYYSSMMPDNQTDIWAYNYVKGIKKQITHTIDSEYSPTVMPNHQYLSCIVQRKKNGDQDLVKFNLLNPAKNSIILASQKVGKIGYQAWMNKKQLIAYILGEPATLQYFKIPKIKGKLIISNIGRSLHHIPNKSSFSFVAQQENTWNIYEFVPNDYAVSIIAPSHSVNTHDHAWTSDGTLIESSNQELWYFDKIATQWRMINLPTQFRNQKISRLAIKGDKIAVVVEETSL